MEKKKKGRLAGSIFAKIESREDALSVVKEVSSWFFAIAGMAAVAYVISPAASFVVNGVFAAVFAFLLRWFYSRAAAIFLLVAPAFNVGSSFSDPSWTGQSSGKVGLGILFCFVAARAVEATFKLHGRFSAGVMSESIWYYVTKDRQKSGPFSLDQLKKKRSSGELGPDNFCWAVGWKTWKKVGDVTELAAPEPPPLPPEEPPPLPDEEPPTAVAENPTDTAIRAEEHSSNTGTSSEVVPDHSEIQERWGDAPGAWFLIIIASIVLSGLTAYLEGLVGGWTSQIAYILGGTLSHITMPAAAGGIVGICYRLTGHAFSRGQFLSVFWVVWVLLAASSMMTALNTRASNQQDESVGAIIGQIVKETAGESSDPQVSNSEEITLLREFFSELISLNEKYSREATKFDTPEMEIVYQPESFSTQAIIETIMGQLRELKDFDQNVYSFSSESLPENMGVRVQATSWSSERKTRFLKAFEKGFAQTSGLRRAVYEQEMAWIDSTIALYELVWKNRDLVTVDDENVYIGEEQLLETFRDQAAQSVELQERFLETSGRFEQAQQALLGKWDLTLSDFGLMEP